MNEYLSFSQCCIIHRLTIHYLIDVAGPDPVTDLLKTMMTGYIFLEKRFLSCNLSVESKLRQAVTEMESCFREQRELYRLLGLSCDGR